jgi:hypothetical protein
MPVDGIDESRSSGMPTPRFSILLLRPMYRRWLPRRLIAFLRRMGFPQTHPWPTAVLVDELDASFLQCAADGEIVGGRHRRLAFCKLSAANCSDADSTLSREVLRRRAAINGSQEAQADAGLLASRTPWLFRTSFAPCLHPR